MTAAGTTPARVPGNLTTHRIKPERPLALHERATLIASALEEDRPRLRVMLLRWSMAMVVVGPIVLLPLLVVFGR